MIQPPDHKWECQDCGAEFFSCEVGQPLHLQGKKPPCPHCGSTNVEGGPIIHDAPPEHPFKKY